MIGYCQKNGTPEPEFQEYSGGFSVVFPFKEPMGNIVKDSKVHQFTQRQEEILKILSSGEKMVFDNILSNLKDAPAPRTLEMS
jgi:ATP-dependent DNA helicase RecG